MTATAILTLNAGSSSLRCALFRRGDAAPEPQVRLSLRGLPSAMLWERREAGAEAAEAQALDPPADPGAAQAAALSEMLDRLGEEVAAEDVAAVAHRVVHGGRRYREPVEATGAVLDDLAALSPLAPSHQPHNVAGLRRLAERFPDAAQVACFDTAFHGDLPWEDRVFALPKPLLEEGVLRYGFHGLSYEHAASALAERAPELLAGRVVVAHLGHGASMCALERGRSVATTMGMTALDGLPMGRRPGALDPGAVLCLIEQKGMAPAELREMLYERSGLLGLSGVSGEMTELLASEDPDAAAAVAFFVYRCRREIGSLTAALGGLDALVFTGGVGENAPEIRARVCDGLDWLGVRLDPAANAAGAFRIAPGDAAVATLVIPTDEEAVLASGAERVLRSRSGEDDRAPRRFTEVNAATRPPGS